MGFVDRAKSMHARGDAVRAAVILAQGLKRDPKDGEAVGWLLHLYVEELPNPGIEADLLQVLSLQPNGADLLAIVRAELNELGLREKSKALDKSLELAPLHFASGPPPSAETVEPAPPDRPASMSGSELVQPPQPTPSGENWESFDSPFGDGAGDTSPQQTSPREPAPPPAAPAAEAPAPASVPEPELADRALSASIDLALSQPLSALEHSGSFKHDYLEEPSGRSMNFGFWAVIVGVAIVCGVLIVGYLSGGQLAEADSPEWEVGPVDGAEGAASTGEGAAAADPAPGEPAPDGESEGDAPPVLVEPGTAEGSAVVDAPADGEGQ